ncbi:MAG: PRC-barrel domain-containing protein [Hyphomonadaceae bacterium]|jgi:hypothetical protein|nr:PRC-barrel domain-containing protein [Hyphomonadaceae bacterium]
MAKGFRLIVASTTVAATLALWASLVQAQQAQQAPQAPQQFPTPDARQSQLRDRLAGAVQRVQDACRDEVRNFCSTVTPGEGRLLLCMQAHEDKIGQPCETALFEASRNIQQVTRRVERIAAACWSDIQASCGGGGSIGQCLLDKRASLSPPCQSVIAATTQQQADRPPQPSEQQAQQTNWVGLPIYSADGARIGEVTAVQIGPDGRVQAVQAEMGHMLGFGTSLVLIGPDDLQLRDKYIELPVSADDVRAILMEQRQ